jgi:SAM-dependent methyltransferase
MREREAWLRGFHARNPGITSRAFGRGGTYEELASRALAAASDVAGAAVSDMRIARPDILDLACGDRPMPGAIGLDVSFDDLLGCEQVVQGRAQQLPFADESFDVVACHLAFMLFDDIDEVAHELLRVLRPGGQFIALLGGGPTADGEDAFHAFARFVPRGQSFGDKRASTEAGWRELFDREPTFERHLVDLSGSFDEVWRFLSASYQAPRGDDVREQLRAQFPGERVPLTVATYFASVTR